MFDSPLHYCPACKQYVALDQTMDQCAAQHCGHAHGCPLAHHFSAPAPTEPVDQSETNKPKP